MQHPGKESNQDRLEKLILSGHSCINIETHEELYTLHLIDSIIKGRLDPLWHWTAVKGVYPGLLADARPIPETEHPAAAMYHLADKEDEPCVAVMIDLAGHLSDARTLRALRELIQRFDPLSSTLILIDHDGSLPGRDHPDQRQNSGRGAGAGHGRALSDLGPLDQSGHGKRAAKPKPDAADRQGGGGRGMREDHEGRVIERPSRHH